MRILFLTNFYPPFHLGGMELRCEEVVEGLRARGHTCLVLTSDFCPAGATAPDQAHVRRVLALDADVYNYRPWQYLVTYRGRLRTSLAALRRAAREFEPDLAFFWGMWNLSPALIATAREALPGRVVQSFAGYWPLEPDAHERYWRSNGKSPVARAYRTLLAPLALSRLYRPTRWPEVAFDHAIFCSRFVEQRLRRGGLAFPHARVIFSGIDTVRFRPASPPTRGSGGQAMAVLFAGAVTPHKGPHIALEAVRLLAATAGHRTSLSIVGRGLPDYEAQLRAQVQATHLQSAVSFLPPVPRYEMPELLRRFDVFVLPTLSEEPLSRAVMEAMACGLAVIGSDTGGTPEMITHGHDGLLVPAGDSGSLAEWLRRLAEDPHLRLHLGQEARRTAEARFGIERMVDEIEQFLDTVLDGAPEVRGDGPTSGRIS